MITALPEEVNQSVCLSVATICRSTAVSFLGPSFILHTSSFSSAVLSGAVRAQNTESVPDSPPEFCIVSPELLDLTRAMLLMYNLSMPEKHSVDRKATGDDRVSRSVSPFCRKKGREQ